MKRGLFHTIKITTWARLASTLCSHFAACPFGGLRITGKEFLFPSHTLEGRGRKWSGDRARLGRQDGETFCRRP